MEARDYDLPDSFFEPATGEEREEIRPSRETRGYFRDALIRTFGRGAARVGAVIILSILIFSLLAPIFI